MSEADAAGALRETMWLLVKLGGPLLVAALVVGLLVSLLQAVTQIIEPTLVFLPKLLVLGAAMARLISVGGQLCIRRGLESFGRGGSGFLGLATGSGICLRAGAVADGGCCDVVAWPGRARIAGHGACRFVACT